MSRITLNKASLLTNCLRNKAHHADQCESSEIGALTPIVSGEGITAAPHTVEIEDFQDLGFGFDTDAGGLRLMFSVKYSRYNQKKVETQRADSMINPNKPQLNKFEIENKAATKRIDALDA